LGWDYDKSCLQYAEPFKVTDVHEDLYNECESHNYNCKCDVCHQLNKISNELTDKKRRFQMDEKELRKLVDKKLKELREGNITFKDFAKYMVDVHPNVTIMSFDVSA